MARELRIMVQPNLSTSGATFQVLHERDGIWIGPPTLGAQALIPASFREETDFRLKNFMLKVDPPDVKNFGFKNFCATRYRSILPFAVQELLEKAAAESMPPGDVPRLNVYSHEAFDWIPWEALFSEKMNDFLGVRFEICRLPIVDTPPAGDSKARVIKNIRHLLGKGVLDAEIQGHPHLYEEWRTTFDPIVPSLLRPQAMIMGQAHDWPGLNELEGMQDDDILHITCHGVRERENNEDRVAWALGSPNVLGEERINEGNLPLFSSSQGRPLIFGNACGSAQTSDLLPGLGTFFFRKGALNVIGTFAPVRIDVAIPFAKEFYKKLLIGNGQTGPEIGKALFSTRFEFHGRPNADVSHLFYCLFGPGGTRFTNGP